MNSGCDGISFQSLAALIIFFPEKPPKLRLARKAQKQIFPNHKKEKIFVYG